MTAPDAPTPPRSTASVGNFAPRTTRVAAFLKRYEGAPCTLVLVVTNLVVFVAEVLHARSGTAILTVPQETMLAFGANDSTFTVAEGRYETLITSCFLHFSILHLVFNMVALTQVGPFVERSVGRGRFLPAYLLSGALGSIASALVGYTTAERLSAGASGAICGLVGAAMVLGVRTQGVRGKLTRSMGIWLVSILGFGFVLGFDNAAHFGGAVTGAGIAALWRRGHSYARWKERLYVGAAVLAVALSASRAALRQRFDPLAFATAEERLHSAHAALAAGRCREAARGLHRAKRLGAPAKDVAHLEGQIGLRCGRKGS